MSELTEFRAEKDQFFGRHPQSPLTPEQKRGFVGLQYFPENEDLRLEVKVEPMKEQEPLQMQTSTGGVQMLCSIWKISISSGWTSRRIDDLSERKWIFSAVRGCIGWRGDLSCRALS